MSTTVEREKREWWVILDGRVARAEGFSCGPDNPGHWWFPSIRYTMTEGHHVFAERGNAVQKAIEELHYQRDQIDAKIRALLPPPDAPR